MSLAAVHVRCRDGALYRLPIWVFPEGFICFDDTEPPELVIWLPPQADPQPTAEEGHQAARAILSRVFGFGASSEAHSAVVDSVAPQGDAHRVVPGGGMELAPARSFFFEVTGRPPRPTIAEGTERYPSRVSGTVFDWPATPLDAKALEIPE